MHPFSKKLLMTAIFLGSSVSIAQEGLRSVDSNLMARLSYDNPRVTLPGGVRRVCIAVSRDGDYRMLQLLAVGLTQRRQGKIPKEEFLQLSTLLEAADFRNLTNHGSPVLREEAERFRAEISLGDRWRVEGVVKRLEHRRWQLQWSNTDGESPFPPSVSKVVDWLQHFEPAAIKYGEHFEYDEYSDVCSFGTGLLLLQPPVANNLQP
jgi:hypothetical protein